MGFLDSIKKIINVPEEEFEEDYAEETSEREASFVSETKKNDPPARIFQSERKSKSVNINQNQQMQVVLVKPDRFDDVTGIADHLNVKKTVVLNLESANREVSRRIIDFISGVAYANKGSIKKVANSTFIVVPHDVDVMGELMSDEFDDGKIYF